MEKEIREIIFNLKNTLIKEMSEDISHKNITLIKDLKYDNTHVDIIKNTKNDERLEDEYELISDLSIDEDNRIKALSKYYNAFGEQICIEIINKLATMYQFSGTKILEQYLYSICTKCDISLNLKIILATSLCFCHKEKDNKGFDALNYICQRMNSDIHNIISNVPTQSQIEVICILMINDKYKKQARDYFCKIINNTSIENDFRYKTILSLEIRQIPGIIYFIKEAAFEFINEENNSIMYRILAGQLLLQKCNAFGDISAQKMTIKQRNRVEIILLKIAYDDKVEYNFRADAADVILRLGTEKNKVSASEIIMILGKENIGVNTVFNNAQNVHNNEIEKSVLEILEFLSSIDTMSTNGPGTPLITFDYVKKQINNFITFEHVEHNEHVEHTKNRDIYTKDNLEKISISFNRIAIDRVLYSKYNCTLSTILLKVWTFITSHTKCEEMKKRLVEELIDMSGTCSSGIASKLANTISGFGDLSIRISWKDQIIANVTGRLNAKIRDMCKDEKNIKLYNVNNMEELEEFQIKLLEEMTIPSINYSKRSNFLTFFRKNLSMLHEELYQEFKAYITPSDFDLYMRSAISIYEIGEYI